MSLPLLTSAALIQTTLLSRVDLGGARPDFMLLLVLSWVVIRGTHEGLVWGFVGGLIVDLLSAGPLAATALALLVVALLAGQPLARGIRSSVARLLLLVFVGVVLYHLVLLSILDWTGHVVDWGFALVRVAAPSALLNASLAPFVQWPLAWLERRTRREGLAL